MSNLEGLDRHTAELFLTGEPHSWRTGRTKLATLLAATTAPGRPDELAGEEAAVAAFRVAFRAPVHRPRPRTPWPGARRPGVPRPGRQRGWQEHRLRRPLLREAAEFSRH